STSRLLLDYPSSTALYTLSLHDALPICLERSRVGQMGPSGAGSHLFFTYDGATADAGQSDPGISFDFFAQISLPLLLLIFGSHRSEEHTSELQSRFDLVCRLLLEKKNKK